MPADSGRALRAVALLLAGLLTGSTIRAVHGPVLFPDPPPTVRVVIDPPGARDAR